MTMPARVTSLEDLAEWLSSVAAQGADRFELWVKVRGAEQERVHTASTLEPFDAADELLVRVERDRRVDVGQAAYAVFAYRGKEKAPLERAIVSPAAQAMAMPVGISPMGSSGAMAEASPSLALTTVLSTMHQMTQEVFGTLQRENEHQRRTNETMIRSSTGHVELLAKSYERTFGDLQGRYDAALKEASALRSRVEALSLEKQELLNDLQELGKQKIGEIAAERRKEKRQDMLDQGLKVAFPVLVSKLTGTPLETGVPGLEEFLDSLEHQQAMAILGVLTRPQQAFVIHLIETRQKARAKAEAEPAEPKGNGENSNGAASAPPPANDDGSEAPS